MTMQRNDDIIPRLSKGAGDGVTKMCAMQVVSWQSGDTTITDYPECSARPLARLVQSLNDRLAGSDGYLSPEDSMVVLDLGWQTVGTAGLTERLFWQWISELLVDPDWGVAQYATPRGASAIRCVAELCGREAHGERVSVTEWREAYAAASADASAAAHAAASAAASAEASAHAAAHAAARAAAYADAAADGAADGAADAAAVAAADARIAFTQHFITRWRELAGLDEPADPRQRRCRNNGPDQLLKAWRARPVMA